MGKFFLKNIQTNVKAKNIFWRLLASILLTTFCSVSYAEHDPLQHFQVNDYYYQQLNKRFSEAVSKPAQPLTVKQTKPILIYSIIPTAQISDYWRRNQVAMQLRLDELGINYQLRSHDLKANSSEEQKRRLLHRALSYAPDYMILTFSTSVEIDFIEKMLRGTNTKLIVQNVTEPVTAWGAEQPLIYVGFDNRIGSEMLANYFKKYFPNTTKYAVNDYFPSYISRTRGQTFINAMNKEQRFNMVERNHTKATHGSARGTTKKLLATHSDLKFIYASSTDIALGTQLELQSEGRSDIKVNGWGGGDAELQSIQDNGLLVTVMRMNDDNGVAMAEAIKYNLEGREDELPLVFSGDFKLVSQDTSAQLIKQYKQQAFRYSGASD